MAETTEETAKAFNNKWVKRDINNLKAKVKQLQAELAERKRQLEVAFEILEEYTPAEKLQKANDKMILLCKGIREEMGQSLERTKTMSEDVKVYEVSHCDLADCPFRARSYCPNFEGSCRLTGNHLTSTIWPLPSDCPLLEKDVIVKIGQKKPLES